MSKLSEGNRLMRENVTDPASSKKKCFVVASVPRSGGTWLFNALRLLLTSSGHQIHAAWVDDYKRDAPEHLHLVKVHHENQIDFAIDRVFTTDRDLAGRLASLVRMGWLKSDVESIKQAAIRNRDLYEFWKERSDCEIRYVDIILRPQQVLSVLARELEQAHSESLLEEISESLNALKPPSCSDYDRITLMHPNHRSAQAKHQICRETIQNILNSLDLNIGEVTHTCPL